MPSLREILATFTVDMAPAAKELSVGNALVDGLVGKLKGLGGVLAGAFAVDHVIGFTNELLQEADALAKQSQALGVSTHELQGWQHAAGLSGSSAGEFTAAFTKFSRNVSQAGAGTGAAAKAFKDLGVELKDSSGKLGAPIDLLDGVAAGLENIEDPAKRTAVMMDLFGRSGAKLLPLFSEGAEGLKALRDEVDELGFAFDDAFLEQAQEYNDNIDRFHSGLKGLAIQAIGPLLPYMVRLSQSLVETTKRIVSWVKETRIVQAALVGLGTLGVAKLIGLLGGLRGAFSKLLPFLLRTVAPLLLIEDVLGFFAGDDSELGAAIDAAFGEGSQQKVRDFVNTVTTGFGEILTTARTSNAEFRRNWEATLDDARKEFRGTFGGEFLGGILAAALDLFFVFTNGASNGLKGLWDTLVALAGAFLFQFAVVGEDIQHIFRVAFAHVADAFGALNNKINAGARSIAETLEELLSAIPGMEETASRLGAGIRDAFSMEFDTSNVESELARHAGAGKYLLGVGEDIERQLRGPGREERALTEARQNFRAVPQGQPFRFDLASGAAVSAPAAPVTNIKQEVSAPIRVQNTFVVPAGTDLEQQRSIQQSATRGTGKALDTAALQAALNPAPG